MTRKSADFSPFSLRPWARETACWRCCRPYSLYRLETSENAIPVNQRRAARCWIVAIVGAENGRTLAVWSYGGAHASQKAFQQEQAESFLH